MLQPYTESTDSYEITRITVGKMLTLVRWDRTDLGHLVLAGGVTGKAAHLAHDPLTREAHHEGGTVGTLDGVAEGAN